MRLALTKSKLLTEIERKESTSVQDTLLIRRCLRFTYGFGRSAVFIDLTRPLILVIIGFLILEFIMLDTR